MKNISYFAAPGLTGSGLGIFTDRQIRKIEELVCLYTGETPKTVKLRSRSRNKVLSRQMIFHFLRIYTKITLVQMAHVYGLQDHSTVVHASAVLKSLMATEPDLRKQVEHIDSVLKEDLRHFQ